MLRWSRARRLVGRLADEDGSTLVLYPFAVLIVLGLGGVALDATLAFQAHREAVDAAAGLATDVAGVLDEARYATTGEVEIDATRAATLVALTNADLAAHPYGLSCVARIRPTERDTVDVTCTGRAEAILLPVGGVDGTIDLVGSATASAVPG